MSPKACVEQLPTIDFSKLDLNDKSKDPEEWDSAKSQVKKAVEEYGCFKAVFTKVSMELPKAILTDLEELFSLPLETKMKNTAQVPNGGYIGKTTVTPLYESLGFIDPTIFENVESLTNVIWPQGKSGFSKNLQSYALQILELEKIVRMMILESLGLQKYIEEHLNYSTTNLRVMKYEIPKNGEEEVALVPHVDQNLITILYQSDVHGLQVQSKLNGEWISVNTSPTDFIVLFGETFYAWTNGRVHAPLHRVTMSGNKERYSIGTFTAAKIGYIVKAPEELVDENHPLLYKQFDFMEVLQLFQKASIDRQKDFPTIIDYFAA